ncbi:GNAT family N-acetyltransferase [Methanoculleus sp. 7T]|jgi:ribosomal-protein-alanine N-acetyltransferase|uniref:GNAT family N-acetyltransferase n=1 Tax=Methanoculleus sp. 7T TaxID=2937282 RepID=UPI0020C066BF|nr:GNAT family N-acetyltransferase [Methanoculleus sp. 7T]MCK8518935.1 GNAT family N-acetyltransferase [Methanoculleus sp. 7T]
MDLIRSYRESDFSAVSALERENSAGDCKPEVFIRQAGVLFAETFLVAECGGEVVGYTIGALVQHRPATGWIVRLAVAGQHRRRGYGERLVAAVTGLLRERGADEVYLSVSPRNHIARALYEKHGFREVDFRPAYFGDGADRCILRKGPDGQESLTVRD